MRSRIYQVRITRPWKGPYVGRIEVRGILNTDCAVWFETGTRYLIFADQHDSVIRIVLSASPPTAEAGAQLRALP